MQSEPDVFVRVLFVCMFLFFGTFFFVFSTLKKRGVTYRATDLKFEIEKNLILEKQIVFEMK